MLVFVCLGGATVYLGLATSWEAAALLFLCYVLFLGYRRLRRRP